MPSPKSSSKPQLYEYANRFQAAAAIKGQPYIYMLLLNVTDTPSMVPYYVGHAEDLNAQLRRNEHVLWHNLTFARPARVLVVAQAPSNRVYDVKEDLIRDFAISGYWLSNAQLGLLAEDRGKALPSIKTRSVQAIKRYVNLRPKDIAPAVATWFKKWDGTVIRVGSNRSVRARNRVAAG